MIFWGPPGCGKTSVASVIASTLNAEFFHLSGVVSKKEDLTKIISKARKNFAAGKQTILFLDEIHRWNKAQQDGLLPFVEKGIVTLIGATTENPSFTIVNALISRSRTFVFERISSEEVVEFFEKNRAKITELYPGMIISPEIFELVGELSDGDLRGASNLLETAIHLKGAGELTREDILAAGEKPLFSDRDGESHYDLISAMHKSLRDSDGDAAIYYIGRLLAGGEDPRYIARRMMNFASEDVGLADPHLLTLAHTAYGVAEKMGMPEAQLPICMVAYALARAPKDNGVYVAMKRMQSDVASHGSLPVPLHIRNAPTSLMKEVGYGKGYEYAHSLPGKKS